MTTEQQQQQDAIETWDELNRLAEERTKQVPMATMPSLHHLTLQDYNQVYEPAEDTYLLLDAIQYEFQQGSIRPYCAHNTTMLSLEDDVRQSEEIDDSIVTTKATKQGSSLSSSSPFVVLEIGCGTGVVSTLFRTQWKSCGYDCSQLQSYATDINRKALQISLETDKISNCNNSSNNRTTKNETKGDARQKKELRSDMDNNNNNTKQDGSCLQLPSLKVIHCDLATSLLPRMKHQVDIILFNPPYVPTEDCEVMDIDGTAIITTTACEGDRDIENYIAAAWAGGKHGRRVIDRAIPQIAQLLRKTVVDTQDGDGGSCSRGQRGGGVAYMVTVHDNQPEELNTTLMQSTQLEMIPLLRRRARNEQLTIQKISWK